MQKHTTRDIVGQKKLLSLRARFARAIKGSFQHLLAYAKVTNKTDIVRFQRCARHRRI